jgi:L-fuconate dehydratase
MPKITRARVSDVRFPTSDALDGSDAMNTAPDYSAAYVVLETDQPGLEGHGLAFTIGRGTEVVCTAIEAYAPLLVGRRLEDLTADPGEIWRPFASDSQLRWLGPEKGAVHLAAGALVNAVWDLWARVEGKPLWKLLADLSPEQVVAAVDFRYIEDALTPADALALLEAAREGREEREAFVVEHGYPAYTTSAGWLGYDDAKVERLAREAVAAGFRHIKLKVGADPGQDLHRARLIRQTVGPDIVLMLDANQVWGVEQAIEATRRLAVIEPWWIEEPTSPDDILGHARIRRAVAPVCVATGEHVQNRIVFKQLFQAEAVDICQLDFSRLAGVNEVLAVLLLAARFGVPVCPHAGGVGLCEYVQHASIFDHIAVSGSMDGRVTEYVDQLHEHFVSPVRVERGRYLAPTAPGSSIEIRPESLEAYAFPEGPVWTSRRRGTSR